MPQPQILIKPNHPKINFGNPITQGLVFDEPLWEGSGTKGDNDVLTDLLGLISGPIWGQTIFGQALDFSQAADGIQYSSSPASINNLSKISIETIFYCRSLGGGGNNGKILFKTDSIDTTSGYFQLFINSFSSQNAISLNAMWSTGEETSAVAIAFNTWYHCIVTYDGTNTSNAPIYYLNGIPQTNLSGGTNPSGSWNTDTSTTMAIGNRVTNQIRNFDGKISYVRFWNRVITPTEVLSLYTNPWQIYQKPSYQNFITMHSTAAPAVNKGNFFRFFSPS